MSSHAVNSKLSDSVNLVCFRDLRVSIYCGKLGEKGWRHGNWSACAACNTSLDHAAYINGVMDVRGLPDGVVDAENNQAARA